MKKQAKNNTDSSLAIREELLTPDKPFLKQMTLRAVDSDGECQWSLTLGPLSAADGLVRRT